MQPGQGAGHPADNMESKGERMSSRMGRRTAAIAAATVAASTAAGLAGAATSHARLIARARPAQPAERLDTCRLVRKLVCYSPAQLRSAYDAAPLIASGIDGSGETVVLPEVAPVAPRSAKARAAGSVSLRESVAAYDAAFDLPAARLSVDGALAPGAGHDKLYGESALEELLDVEMVRAIAPGAAIQIDLFEHRLPASLPPLLHLAASQGQAVSLSFGIGESCFPADTASLQSALGDVEAAGLSVFASSGDNGDLSRGCNGRPTTHRGITLPGSDPLITSVGGTSLKLGAGGAYGSEVAWGGRASSASTDNPLGSSGRPIAEGSGGGFSKVFGIPPYQVGVPGIVSHRGLPDVAFDANTATGVAQVAVLDGKVCAVLPKLKKILKEAGPGDARTTLAQLATRASGPATRCEIEAPAGGTSAGSPAWAAIAALADQYAGRSLGFLNPAIYAIAEGPSGAAAFHDVTSGSNTTRLKSGKTVKGYSAGPGWDPVTGWGSPDIARLVPLLAAATPAS